MKLEIAGVPYFSLAAVLADVDVSRQTLWRWRREGRIPQGHRYRNGQLLFTGDEYRKILAYANRVQPDALTANSRLPEASGKAR